MFGAVAAGAIIPNTAARLIYIPAISFGFETIVVGFVVIGIDLYPQLVAPDGEATSFGRF